MTAEPKRPRGRPRKDAIVGKVEMARMLRWTVVTLDRFIDRHPDFPVLVDGRDTGQWQFLSSDVRAFVDSVPPTPARERADAARLAKGGMYATKAAKAARAQAEAIVEARKKRPRKASAAAPASAELMFDDEDTSPIRNARGVMNDLNMRLKEAQTGLVEDKLRIARGELIDKSQLQMNLAQLWAKFGKFCDSLPVTVGKRAGLPDATIRLMREILDDERRIFVAGFAKAVSSSAPVIEELPAEEEAAP